jgi:hypothetical protein
MASSFDSPTARLSAEAVAEAEDDMMMSKPKMMMLSQPKAERIEARSSRCRTLQLHSLHGLVPSNSISDGVYSSSTTRGADLDATVRHPHKNELRAETKAG